MSFFKALFKDNATASLRYPLATLTEESDYLLMEVIEYKPSNLEGGALERALENGVGNQSPKRKASIILPIPTNITRLFESNFYSLEEGLVLHFLGYVFGAMIILFVSNA